jgi:hypothetical protein
MPSRTLWLAGAALDFDGAVVAWLRQRGWEVTTLDPLPRPRVIVPGLSRWLRRQAYSSRMRSAPPTTLVLPYLAGDSLLLAGLPGLRTLGVALGSDILQRRRQARSERLFQGAVARYDALWAVSDQLGDALTALGRSPTWISAVGVDVSALCGDPGAPRRPSLVFSARREGDHYRHELVRAAARGASWHLVEAGDFTQRAMFEEFLKAEVVVSVPVSDGAPATLMEAMCLGAHVVASGGRTVRDWIGRFGGTYGEPQDPAELRALVDSAIASSRRETAETRRTRARAARAAFARDDLLSPLERWLGTAHHAKELP